MKIGLPPIAELLKTYRLGADKNLGQNFLLRNSTLDALARMVHCSNAFVFEIGPGPTGFTRALFRAGASHVLSLEKDTRFLPLLQQLKDSAQSRFDFAIGDVLKVDLEELHSKSLQLVQKEALNRVHLVGNLPFNITGKLMILLLQHAAQRSSFFTNPNVEMTFMFQREVAEQLASIGENMNRSRLSILTQTLFEPSIVAFIPHSEFYPPPKVNAAMVKFVPVQNPIDARTFDQLSRLLAIVSIEKRKQIAVKLKDHPHLLAALETVGIDPVSRIHQIPISQLLELSKFIDPLA